MGKQKSRVAKKITSSTRPAASNRGDRSTAQAPLPVIPSGSGATAQRRTSQNPARQTGAINLTSTQQCSQLVRWLSGPASSASTSTASASNAGPNSTTVENVLNPMQLVQSSPAVVVEQMPQCQQLFSQHQSIFANLQTSPTRDMDNDILCPDSQPWELMSSDATGGDDNDGRGSNMFDPPLLHSACGDLEDDTQIPEDPLVSEEEWGDAAGDDEVLDPTFQPEFSQSPDDEAAVTIAAVPQAQTTTVPTAITPAVLPVAQVDAPSMVRGKPKTSSAWAFFVKSPNSPTDVICKLCKNKYSRGKNPFNLSTTVMTRHMAAQHAIVWQNHNRANVGTASGRGSTPSAPRIAAAGDIPTDSVQVSVPHSSPSTSTDSIACFSVSQQSSQLSVQQMWGLKTAWPANNTKVKALNCRLAKLLAAEMLPYSFVDTAAFRSFMSLACPRYKVPSRHYFAKSAIPTLHQHVVDNITSSMKQSVSVKVHFTTDTWTAKHGQGRYLTMTAHWVNLVVPAVEGTKTDLKIVRSPRFSGQSVTDNPSSAASSSSTCTVVSADGMEGKQVPNSLCRGQRRQAVLHLRTLGDRSHTGRELWTALSEEFERWLTPLNLEPGYVVSDNATNLLSALRQGHLQHVPCMAHVLNLVVQRFLKKYPGLQSLLSRVREVCAHFRRAPTSTTRLMALQLTLGLPNNRLICDVATRWNSTFLMVQRFCEQKRALISYSLNYRMGQRSADLGHFSPSEWDQLHHICNVLSSFLNATEMVSGEEALISISVPVVFLLEQTLNRLRREERSMRQSEEEESPDVDEPEMRSLAPTQTEEAASAMAEEVEEEGTPSVTIGEPDQQSSGFTRGWQEEEEESSIPTFIPNVASGIGPHGSVSHMSAFMLHFLQHDPRIKSIKNRDHYWLATILDPRYKSRVLDMLPPDSGPERLQQLKNKIVRNIMFAFPATNSSLVAAQQSNTPLPQGSVRQGSSSATASHTSGGNVDFGVLFHNFFKPSIRADVSTSRTEGQPERIKIMVNEYMGINFDSIPKINNPFDYWVSKMDLWPELARYAVEVLSCPAASVLSERVFSCAGNIITDNRTRLSASNVDRLTQIKMNESWICDNYNVPTENTDD